jgi:Zn finger protein HypA/HybF involved in hydrogenase expression
MGATYSYSCDKCELEATVSGGQDFGMYAEWRTVWCADCGELSDVTTVSENTSCLSAEFRKRQELPTGLPCPDCKSTSVQMAEKNICPKCHGSMAEHQVGPRFRDRDQTCKSCGFSVNLFESAPRLSAAEDDTVTVRLFCAGCENYVLTTFHRRGAYAPMSEWVEHELKCRRCNSSNVRPWNQGEPCPSCGGNLESTGEIAEFCD